MIFRRTKVANGLDGKSYYTYRLVENRNYSGTLTPINLQTNGVIEFRD